jgi:hypothetical protein
MTLAFERLPRESAKAHAAFREYLDLGAERSLALVAARLGKSKVLMERWSRRYDWAGRIAAQAAHAAEIERQTIEGLAVERAIQWHKVEEAQRIAEWKLRTEYYELALEGIQRWKENPKRVGSLEGLARLGEVFVKLGRLAAGMPSEVKEVNTTVTGTIDIEWEAALRKTFGPRDGGNPKVESRSPKGEVVEVVEVGGKADSGKQKAEIGNGGER